jgi:hypothetical protein
MPIDGVTTTNEKLDGELKSGQIQRVLILIFTHDARFIVR